MAAYLIAEHIITDEAKFEQYRTKVGPMIAKQIQDATISLQPCCIRDGVEQEPEMIPCTPESTWSLISIIGSNMIPPRDPDDDDEDEEDNKHEDNDEEPPVVREPEE
jgi:hypothetical protein